MFPTVSQQPLRQDRSSPKETTDLANATRRGVNMISRARVTFTTAATGVFTTVWTSEEMPEGSAWALDYHIVCRTTAGTPGRCRYDQDALFFREVGGVATQQGATGTISPAIESIVAASAQFLVVGNTIAIQVLDDGLSTFNWDVMIEGREVL